ncbi:MAG: DMT family transporter [Paracoccaceae bacterium]|nr:MAG: DMT family transporter [Paracoccaceae bacterium]
MSRADWALLLLLSVLWGGSFLFVALALRGLAPLTLVWLRVALAALVLLAVLRAGGTALPPRRAWGALAVMGLVNNALPFTLIAVAQGQIDAGLAATLNATTPLFTVIVAAAAGVERVGGLRVAGVLAGLAGVAALMGGGAGAPGAQALCLGAALLYALAGVWGRRLAGLGLSPPAAAFGMLASAALWLAPVVLIHDTPFTRDAPGAAALASVAALAVLCTALAYLIYFRLLARAGAVNLSLVTFLIPVSAIATGVAFLAEHVGPAQVAGLVLIGVGLWLVTRGARA